MNLEISVEKLRQNKLFIATPMYGGLCYGMFMKSCLDLQSLCQNYGIETRFSFIFNESLVQRARNYLADEYLRSGYSHLLFLDSDIGFDPRDVLALLALDKDIIGAPYPKKSINFARIKEAIIKNPQIDNGELAKLAGDYVFNAIAGTGQFNITQPIEVMEIGTGYSMMKRRVFEHFEKAYPELKYKPDHVGQAHFDGSRYIHAYFHCEIDRDIGLNDSERYLSEDYFFFQKSRAMKDTATDENFKIWMCPWMKTIHNGTYQFLGDMPAVAQHVQHL